MEVHRFVFAVMILFLCRLATAASFMDKFRHSGIDVKPVIHVVSEEGEDIPNATVSLLFRTGRGSKEKFAKTDASGFGSALGKMNLQLIIRINASGHYETFKVVQFSSLTDETKIKNDIRRWQDEGIMVTLRKKKHPNSERKIIQNFIGLPTNKWVMLDLDARPIHGIVQVNHDLTNGHFQVRFSMSESNKEDESYKGLGLKLRIQAESGGFIFLPRNNESDFIYTHEAPESGYVNEVEFSQEKIDGRNKSQVMDEHRYYCLFKVADGDSAEAISYRYGIITFFKFGFNAETGTAFFSIGRFFNTVEEENNTEYQGH